MFNSELKEWSLCCLFLCSGSGRPLHSSEQFYFPAFLCSSHPLPQSVSPSATSPRESDFFQSKHTHLIWKQHLSVNFKRVFSWKKFFCPARIPPPLEPSHSSLKPSRLWEASPNLDRYVASSSSFSFSFFLPLLMFLSLSFRPILKSLTWLRFMTTSMRRNMQTLWRTWVSGLSRWWNMSEFQ